MHFCPFSSFFNFFHTLPIVPSSAGNKKNKRTTAQSISFHNNIDEKFHHHQEEEVTDECTPSSSTSPSRQLSELPNELLIGLIFSYLDLKDICALKQVCHHLNELCHFNRHLLPKGQSNLVMIRCGQWQNVLDCNRPRRRMKKCQGKRNPLMSIDFCMPLEGENAKKWQSISFDQLCENFRFKMAFFDIQVLNLDLLNQLQLTTICVEHVVLAFRYDCHAWPVRHCFGEMITQLGRNKFVKEVDILFPDDLKMEEENIVADISST